MSSSAVYPAGLHVGEPAVADEVTGQLSQALAPALRQLAMDNGPAAGEGLGRRADPHWQLPACVLRGGLVVVQQDLVLIGQLLRANIAAVHRPKSVVGGAAQLTAVCKAQAHDRLDAVAHERDGLRCHHACAWSLGGGAVCVDPKVLARLAALHQLGDAQQAEGGVYAGVGWEARVRRVDPPAVRRGVPLVDRRVVLHARVGAAPGGLGDFAHQLARWDRLADRLAGGAGGQPPLAVLLDGAHELVGDPHRVVRVLVLDRLEALAVDRHVKAGVAQSLGLVLLLGLAPDELTDVGMIDVEHDHLRRTAGLATGLDRARPRVRAAHERDRPRGGAALGQRLHRAADVRQVDARARAAAEDHPLLGVPVEDRLHRVLDGEDEAGTSIEGSPRSRR